jgi:hypothetical protein
MRDVEVRTEPEVKNRPLSDADRAVLEEFANRLRGEEGEAA